MGRATAVTEDAASEVIVVGAGPAGITAAETLARRGATVTIIDAGDGPVTPPGFPDGDSSAGMPLPPASLDAFRRARATHDPNVSPKFATDTARRIGGGFAETNDVGTDNFHLFGALGGGGLSAIWGGLTAPFDEDDLRAFPFSARDLKDSYAEVARRIGISGGASDVISGRLTDGLDLQPPLELHPTQKGIADRYLRRRGRIAGRGVKIGAPLQAVLTRDLGIRRACDYRGACLYGCANGAIYNAAFAIPGLTRLPNVRYRPGIAVQRLIREGLDWHLETTGGRLTARTVVLAAGTIATTRLFLASALAPGRRVRILHNPVFAAGCLVPSRIGARSTERSFGMAQLALEIDMSDAGTKNAYGLLYSTTGLGIADLVEHMPFSTGTSVRVLAAIREALVPVTCFFPGSASDTRAEITADGRLEITGGYDAALDTLIGVARRRLFGALRRLGAYYLPGSLTVGRPGADLHYAGTLPMGQATDGACRVVGTDGLYVVDGSVFPELPARPCTFTIMAIADRAMRMMPLAGDRE